MYNVIVNQLPSMYVNLVRLIITVKLLAYIKFKKTSD